MKKVLIALSLSFLLSAFMGFISYAQTQRITGDSVAIGLRTSSKINLDGSITARSFNGKRPITGSIATGQNPNTNDLIAWINAIFYPSQTPTASLTGGATYEISPSSVTKNLNWSYGKQMATENITSAVINQGVGSVFTTQPSPGSSVSGTVSVTTPAGVGRAYTLTVTTSDGKTATSTTTDLWMPKKYWGRTANTNANAADLLAGTGGGSVLSNVLGGTYTITASGSNRVFIAYPEHFGNLTSIVIGGLESIGAFNKTVISFTNASGYTQNYSIYTSINPTSGNVTAVTN